MIYALLGTGAAGTIAALVLLIQRNAARTDAAEQRTRAGDAEQALRDCRDALQRQSLISDSLRADVDRLSKERNALAAKDPVAAGDLLAGVLSPPGNPDATAAGLPHSSAADSSASSPKSRG